MEKNKNIGNKKNKNFHNLSLKNLFSPVLKLNLAIALKNLFFRAQKLFIISLALLILLVAVTESATTISVTTAINEGTDLFINGNRGNFVDHLEKKYSYYNNEFVEYKGELSYLDDGIKFQYFGKNVEIEPTFEIDNIEYRPSALGYGMDWQKEIKTEYKKYIFDFGFTMPDIGSEILDIIKDTLVVKFKIKSDEEITIDNPDLHIGINRLSFEDALRDCQHKTVNYCISEGNCTYEFLDEITNETREENYTKIVSNCYSLNMEKIDDYNAVVSITKDWSWFNKGSYVSVDPYFTDNTQTNWTAGTFVNTTDLSSAGNLTLGGDINDWTYTGTSYDISAYDTSPYSIFFDGTYWYMLGTANRNISKFDVNWNYIENVTNVLFLDNSPQYITWDGTNWFLLGSQNDNVYKFNSDWTYTGTSYDVSSEDTSPIAIGWDGKNFWMVGYAAGADVYNYTSDWTYTSDTYDISPQGDAPRGMHWDGKNWWITDNINDKADRYDSAWNYQTSFLIKTQDASPSDIHFDGLNWLYLGNTNNAVFKYGGNFSLEGTFTSQVFDAGSSVSWDDLSWASNEPTGTNISIDVRSCDDNQCSGESWANKKSFSSPLILNTTITPDNQYFQYKAYLETSDVSVTPYLELVNISYTGISVGPSVATTLSSPANQSTDTDGTITFSCSATATNSVLVNITLYYNVSGTFAAYQTKSLSGTQDSETFGVTLGDGTNILWNCLAYNNATNSSFAANNRTVDIRIPPPEGDATLLSLQGKVTNSTGGLVDDADLTAVVVNTNDCNAGGNSLIYNHTFTNEIQNGIFSVLLGNITNLVLEYNKDYYLCTSVDNELVGSAQKFRGGQGEIGGEDIEDNVNLNNVTLGTTTEPTKLQMYSPDGSATCCGADDSDVWSCTAGYC